MQPEIESEGLITLSEAAKRLPGKPSLPTLWRWCAKGVRGVRLAHLRLGRRIFTTVEALNEFGASCTRREAPKTIAISTDSQLPIPSQACLIPATVSSDRGNSGKTGKTRRRMGSKGGRDQHGCHRKV